MEWSGPSSKVNEGKRSSILNCDNSVREESETKWDVNEMERESFFSGRGHKWVIMISDLMSSIGGSFGWLVARAGCVVVECVWIAWDV